MKRAYLLTEAQASLLAFAAEKIVYEDNWGTVLTASQKTALEKARTALAQPLKGIVPQAEHEHHRRYTVPESWRNVKIE